MHRKKQPTLTEFSRNFEESDNFVVKFITKFSKSNTSTANVTNDVSLLSSTQQTSAKCRLNTDGQSVASNVDVLNIEERGSLRDYKNTDFHRYWMPDEKAKLCYDCAQKFTSFRRKHHCRLCGQIFCSKCCNQIVSGRIIMCSDDLKVCIYCSNTVSTYLQAASVSTEFDLKENDVSVLNSFVFNEAPSLRQPEALRSNSITGYEEEQFLTNTTSILTIDDRNTILKESDSLKALYEEMVLQMPHKNHGIDLLRFLFMSGKSSNNDQAIEIINALLAAGFLIPIAVDSENIKFHATLSYELINASDAKHNKSHYNHGYDEKSKEIPCRFLQTKSQLMKSYGNMNMCSLKSNFARAKQLFNLYSNHEHFFIHLLLKKENLEPSWASILATLCAQVANGFKPISSGQRFMDIRHYVSFKKVEGGSKKDCCIKGGVIFTKNVAHNAMINRIKHPKVLLLQCPIMYERIERKYLSMETLLLQEKEYLRNVVVRILSLKPNIILVHYGMARIAQEMLHNFGIILVLNVKSSVMQKLTRCMQCDMITSVESNIKVPKLGTCDLFFTESFADTKGVRKTLMGFEVFSSPRNYVFILRGGFIDELIRVKRIASILLYSRYNWRFEMSFLLDIFANPQFTNSHLSMKEFALLSNSNIISTSEIAKDGSLVDLNDEKLSDLKEMYENDEGGKSQQDMSVLLFGEKIIPNVRDSYQYHPKDIESKTCKGSRDIHIILADFRAFGKKKLSNVALLQESLSWAKSSKLTAVGSPYFDIQDYQHIPVLFCCFYCSPKAASSFCVEPALIDMDFYGKNDIMLGLFLEKYCFRSYICHSCSLPMTDHIRRYVHATGCIQVLLAANHSTIKSDEILVSLWCTICNESTSVVPLSQDTWCLSFGKYLELRFYDHFYQRSMSDSFWNNYEIKREKNICSHAKQHNYVQCFQRNGLAVKFSYTNIEVWEINFPPSKVYFSTEKSKIAKLIESKNNFLSKGNSIYMKIHSRINEHISSDSECRTTLLFALNRDFSIFKQNIQNIENLFKNKLHKTCKINDLIVNAERTLQANVNAWNLKLDLELHSNALQQVKVLGVESENEIDDSRYTKQNLSPENIPSSSEDRHVITSLNQKMLISTTKVCIHSCFCCCEAHVLPMEILPVSVNEQDFSSIIAYSLATEEYRKHIDGKSNSHENINNQSKVTKLHERLFNIDDVEDRRIDEEKKNKAKAHIELCFQNETTQFSCKIYFASEFDLLREKVFCTNRSDITEARNLFVRSLSTSLSWEARGGKSGSKFSKTWDDRFILKEMTKGDITSFENLGPYYFEYINSCLSNSETTLLTKILGIYKLSMKKKDFFQERTLLVMENLFYGLEIKDKFDLKGSERNRHVNPENMEGEIVLLDENLIKMSWSKPLYIKPHSKSCLRKAINMDSTFLEQNAIIDYSLLVGLNKENGTLILGIIDYVRTFTFDKRLESLVKQSGLLGGQGKLPTVIAPQRYKQRFTEAMERYFLVSPDKFA